MIYRLNTPAQNVALSFSDTEMNIKCFLIEDTGRRTEFIDGVSSAIYRRVDTGEELHGKKPAGAMWFCEPEYQQYYQAGPDGRTLFVETPGGTWTVDSQASNCTKPNDKEHRCWCRHGDAPNITVNKIGNTCFAGAGSILMANFHGFLIDGELVEI